MGDQEWCAHGPALNCKDCRIEELEANAIIVEDNYKALVEELEAEVERLQVHKKSAHKLIANACAENERLKTERRTLPEYDDAISAISKENERLEAENEKLRKQLDEQNDIMRDLYTALAYEQGE